MRWCWNLNFVKSGWILSDNFLLSESSLFTLLMDVGDRPCMSDVADEGTEEVATWPASSITDVVVDDEQELKLQHFHDYWTQRKSSYKCHVIEDIIYFILCFND